MSAEVIAGDLGLDLYTVNLATVVDKYVGETEKNLERIFTEAAGVNGVLLFDEGRRDFRQAFGSTGRARPLREHGKRVFVAAHRNLRRPRHPRHQPAGQPGRGLHSPTGHRGRFPGPRRAAAPRALGRLSRSYSAPFVRCGPGLPRRFLRTGRRAHPVGRRHRRVPGRRGRPLGEHGRPRRRGRPGIPQARAAGAGTRIRKIRRSPVRAQSERLLRFIDLGWSVRTKRIIRTGVRYRWAD
ncbi:AAA family ATPase [Fodinicola feengrottensis]|uniref:AAA family ATPase n=1 Tax=Fodinicola feengrottensis TaxID=435914 RepID=UPI0024421377|nr:AAA family ATPase [Fodinicola feengrottensis]